MERSESLSPVEPIKSLSAIAFALSETEAAQIAAKNWLKLRAAQKNSLNIYLETHRRGKKKAATIIIIGGLLGGGLAASGIVSPTLYALGAFTFIGFLIGAGIAVYQETYDFKADAKKAYEQSFGGYELLYMLSDPAERLYEEPTDKKLAELNKQDLPNILEQTTLSVEETRVPLKTLALAIFSNLLLKNESLDLEDRQLIIETLLLRYSGCELWRFYEVNQAGTAYLRSKVRPAISANHAAADQLLDTLVNVALTNNQSKRIAECLDYLMEKISKTRTDKTPLAVKTLITRLNNKLETNSDFAKHAIAAMKIENRNRFLSLYQPKEIHRLDRVIKNAVEIQPTEKKLVPESSGKSPTMSQKSDATISNVSIIKRISIFASEKASEAAAFFRRFRHPGTSEERQGLLVLPAHDVESPSSESDESFKGPTN